MMRPYLLYKCDGSIWRAGHTVLGLCSAWNHATKPTTLMTDAEHRRASTYARAIKARMKRLGYVYGLDYIELSNADLWPKPYRETLRLQADL